MPRHTRNPTIPHRPPKPYRTLTLSELRGAFADRGLELVVAEGIAIREGERVLHQPRTLTEASAWLDCASVRSGRIAA